MAGVRWAKVGGPRKWVATPPPFPILVVGTVLWPKRPVGDLSGLHGACSASAWGSSH